MKLILRYVKSHLPMFFTAVFFLTIETFADLLQPTMMSYVIDNGVKKQDITQILRYGAMMLAIAAAGAVSAVMRNIYATKTSQLIGKEMRLEIYRKVQSLSFENIDRLQPSSIITRITNDVTQIQNFVNGCMRIMLKAPITCVGAIALIIIQTPKQAPVILAILCISAVLIGGNMKMGYPRFGKMQKKLDSLNRTSREFLAAIRVVKAFRAEEQEEMKFQNAAADLADAGVAAMRVMAVFAPLINLTVNFGIVMLLWLSGREVSGDIGKLMASVNYMTQVLFALGIVSNILNTAVRAAASASRVEEILNEVPAQKMPAEECERNCEKDSKKDMKEERKQNHIRGNITFENVSFTYASASKTALENIDFQVNPGETIGIIGPTGAGKSTLVNLVPRFYDAGEGRILVDGKDVTEVNMKTLRKDIAVVPQKALLFSGSIADNLRWGDENASDEKIYRAAETACAHEFVMDFPEKYDTYLGQGGVNLSGGQKQRLSIARALLAEPKILILDDCTSALDASTEAKVLQGLKNTAGDMTVLLISQRISTVMGADKILCMEDGRIQGFGSHEKLMKECKTYRSIYASQIGNDKEDRIYG